MRPFPAISQVASKALGSTALQGVFTIADQAVVSLSSFAATVIVGRTLGKQDLGVFALGMTLFWLSAALVNALVWVPYTAKACRLDEQQRDRYRSHCTLMAFGLSLVLAGALLLIGSLLLLTEARGSWLPPFCFAVAPLVVTRILREHIRRVGVADFRSRSLVAMDGLIGAASVGGLVLLASNGWLTPTLALWTTALAAVICLPRAWRLAASGTPTHPGFIEDLRTNWGFGRWMLVVAAGWLVGDGALRWMLAGMHGLEAVGVFGAAFAVVMLVNPLILAMNSFVRTWAARTLDSEGARSLISHVIRQTLAAVGLSVVAIICLSWIGDYAIKVLFGPEFADPKLVLLLATAVCVKAIGIPIDSAMTAMEMGKRMTHGSLIQVVTTVVVGAPLVYLYGPMGIGWAMIARYVPLYVMYWGAVLQVKESTACSRPASKISASAPSHAAP